MPTSKENVLFLCTGNSARSQMAEALFRQHAGDQFDVYSAGIEPKGINPYSIRAMDEIGIDIRGQSSKSMEVFIGNVSFRYVITVCGHADQNCPQALWAMNAAAMANVLATLTEHSFDAVLLFIVIVFFIAVFELP